MMRKQEILNKKGLTFYQRDIFQFVRLLLFHIEFETWYSLLKDMSELFLRKWKLNNRCCARLWQIVRDKTFTISSHEKYFLYTREIFFRLTSEYGVWYSFPHPGLPIYHLQQLYSFSLRQYKPSIHCGCGL